jgi:hypothetical protein
MNIYSVIKKDHDEARGVMDEIIASKSNKSSCEQLLGKLRVAILRTPNPKKKLSTKP